MIDTHQKGYLLLQGVRLRFLGITWAFLKHFHGVLGSGVSVGTQVNGCKMPFSKLLEDPILLPETICVPRLRIPENEARFIQNADLVTVLKLAMLVLSNDSVVDEGAIGGQILQNCDNITLFVLREQQKVSIGYRWGLKEHI